ncbi:hypothetical protein MKW92_042260 [Papaver armeniacum]|nr:hypothetical protein MKW92_042260 [Papaver armeniacum]
MSEYENVVVGKLKLKGKALDVKNGGLKKKKKQKKVYHERIAEIKESDLPTGSGGTGLSADAVEENENETNELDQKEHPASIDDHLTPAERLAKTSNKYHRDRIQDFNQYLANMSEHYDIPKVGPG